MRERIIPRYTFEKELPKGWYLSRLCNSRKVKGFRVLYFKDIIAARIVDTFNLENDVKAVIENPPECVQEALYIEGQISSDRLSDNVKKSLIKRNVIPYGEAQDLFPELSPWLDSFIPKVAEYAGKQYTFNAHRWYDEEGNCINSNNRFLSTWDARVKYAKGECSLLDVAKYSWAGVLECLGDDHQRYIKNRLIPKLLASRHGVVWVQKFKLKEKEEDIGFENGVLVDRNKEKYLNSINHTLYNYFLESKEHQIQMFTEDCRVEGFKEIKGEVAAYERKMVKLLSSIVPELGGFKWNDCMKVQEPVFAPKPMSISRREEFFNLVHSVIIGEMSGHEAALYFTNAAWFKIERETRRYEKHLTQYVPFYSDCWHKLDAEHFSFGSSVAYVRDSIRDLIELGYRDKEKYVTAFNYDGLRFTVNAHTGEVKYVGLAGGNYLPDAWIHLKSEVRRKILKDDAEWEYQEKAIKRYNKLFSYLYNIVHKHHQGPGYQGYYYLESKEKAKKKYLRPSSNFFNKMKEKADKYIKSLERGVVAC